MTASHATIDHPAMHDNTHQNALDIGKILDRGGIFLDFETTSKKRLLEQIAEKFSGYLKQDTDDTDEQTDKVIDAGTIFSTLFERENLGSTGIGSGVALPHGRIPGQQEVSGIFLRLQDPLDFDAADHLPVNLVFAILVPEDATDEHLNLLACLASIFRDDDKRKKLLETDDPSLIREMFSGSENCKDIV